MPTYEEQSSNYKRFCPYCGHSHEVEAEDYTEDTYTVDCECGKKYFAVDSFEVTHHSRPDCELNGYQHKWESLKVSSGYHDFCAVCGKCRRL